MGRKKPREIPGDDGETVVNMNVEGMPWYVPKKRTAEQEGADHYQMTREELRTYKWAAVKAGLTIVLVFGTVFAAFIAFCDFIWFRK